MLCNQLIGLVSRPVLMYFCFLGFGDNFDPHETRIKQVLREIFKRVRIWSKNAILWQHDGRWFCIWQQVWCHVAKLCNRGLIPFTHSPSLLRTTHSPFLLRRRPWGESKNTALWWAHIASVVSVLTLSIRPFVWPCSSSSSSPLLEEEYSEVCRLEWIFFFQHLQTHQCDGVDFLPFMRTHAVG